MKQKWIEKALDIARNGDIKGAYLLQKKLKKYISLNDKDDNYIKIAGVDISYTSDRSYCSVVVIDRFSMNIVERSFTEMEVSFPYVPGLLFFREFPIFFKCFQCLSKKPDLIIFDGHGLSHQRMMGIATMAGILLNIPTIGCAKSYLYGEYNPPDLKKFSRSELRVNNLLVGYVFRSKERVKPIFVSTGYKISPEMALKIVASLVLNNKLPLPTHLAHKFSEEYKELHRIRR